LKERIKRNLGYIVASFSALMLLGIGVASANGLSAINEDTGEDSRNEAKLDIDNQVDVRNDNRTDIDSILDIAANTGDNEANDNEGDGDVESGDIDLAVEIANLVGFNRQDCSGDCPSGDGMGGCPGDCSNNNHGKDFCCPFGGDIAAGNFDTGEDSRNEAKVYIDNDVKIRNDNRTDIRNDISACLNTGDNEANHNDGDGTVSTGNINVDASVNNVVNNTSASSIPGACCPFGGDIDATNEDTGEDSVNESKVDIDNDIDIRNDNRTDIRNDLSIRANTGDNEANHNDGDGTVITGDISATIDFTNKVMN